MINLGHRFHLDHPPTWPSSNHRPHPPTYPLLFPAFLLASCSVQVSIGYLLIERRVQDRGQPLTTPPHHLWPSPQITDPTSFLVVVRILHQIEAPWNESIPKIRVWVQGRLGLFFSWKKKWFWSFLTSISLKSISDHSFDKLKLLSPIFCNSVPIFGDLVLVRPTKYQHICPS